MKYKLEILFFLVLPICFSCGTPVTSWQKEVLVHYTDSVLDMQKYRAAQFLIENMDEHYTLYNEGMDSFRLFMDSVFRLPHRELSYYDHMYDSVIALYGNSLMAEQERICDTAMVTADYLIANIDDAFRMWKTKWNID
jgi:hypothetical protein